jgi:predicted DNA-binding transcriptional regulator AlpA
VSDHVEHQQPTEIWTFKELGEFLKMTRRQCYNLSRARGQARMDDPLPLIKINGNVRFRRADVEAWLERMANRNKGDRR